VRPKGNASAPLSVLFGLLSVAALPAAVIAARESDDLTLVEAGVVVPAAALLALIALWLARRARRRADRTLDRVGGRGAARVGKLLGGVGLYLAATAALALGVYALLSASV
jgi:predicted lysophospholipase L1 biosynthesis ABC-type transport system permease subunit